jgi:DNA repair protein RadA/Sms
MSRCGHAARHLAERVDRRAASLARSLGCLAGTLMARTAGVFTCADCGYSATRWLGRCPGCGAFGTLVEEHQDAAGPAVAQAKVPVPLGEVEIGEADRISTRVPELDRVLGGGLVPASVVLVGGEPGVGKSTLLLAALGAVSATRKALLVTGEESAAQVKLRAERLGGAPAVAILAETDLDSICATLVTERPDVCVIDSVQTLHTSELSSGPGSVAQVREAAARLLRVAKDSNVTTILVGHVTKDGAVAGPRVLEHLVDCVLQFEGDRYRAHRVLRATKNRFGSTNELGVFEMTGAGLVGVPDPSEVFGSTTPGEIGAAVGCALEGTRPLLLEVQALVAPTELALPRRVATGVDPRRLAMIVAVLGRHAGLALAGADVFVNVAGGVRIDEPGADLAIALAIASASRGIPVRERAAAFGEIGLTGRLRPASQADRRLDECRKLGVVSVLAPEGTPERDHPRVVPAETLRVAVRMGLGEGPSAERAAEVLEAAPSGRKEYRAQAHASVASLGP